MNFISTFAKSLGKISGNDKSIKVIVAVGLIGMALILISHLTDTGRRAPPIALDSSPASVDEYTSMLEARLEELITSIEGVGRAKVMLTHEDGQVQGVVIVCDGADDIRVVLKLTNVVTTALNIPSTRVYITKLTDNNYN